MQVVEKGMKLPGSLQSVRPYLANIEQVFMQAVPNEVALAVAFCFRTTKTTLITGDTGPIG